MAARTFTNWNGTAITANTDNITIDGHYGTWYVVDTNSYNGQEIFELEHEEHGEDACHLIVDENGHILLDDVWNGWDDLELLDSPYWEGLE